MLFTEPHDDIHAFSAIHPSSGVRRAIDQHDTWLAPIFHRLLVRIVQRIFCKLSARSQFTSIIQTRNSMAILLARLNPENPLPGM